MIITSPDDVPAASHLTKEEIVVELAIILYSRNKLTLAHASALCGMKHIQFQHLPASRDISIHYDTAEFEKD